MVRFVLSWNIIAEEESAYFEFIVRDFVPRLGQAGVRLNEAWLTLYGEGPQIIMSGVAPDRESFERLLQSREWQALTQKLKQLVTDYQLRILDDEDKPLQDE
ncbi:MAG: hypothetical protein ACK4WM_07760 [Thermoflexales bacterium]